MREHDPSQEVGVQKLEIAYHSVELRTVFNVTNDLVDYGKVELSDPVRVGRQIFFYKKDDDGKTTKGWTSAVEKILPRENGSYMIVTDSGSAFLLTVGEKISIPAPQKKIRASQPATHSVLGFFRGKFRRFFGGADQ